jgi:hypothetical protein
MPHPGKQALFVLLSLADLALTCWLLGRSGGQVYEANPVASWWLTQHGAAGLACFKGAVVLLVLGLAVVISRSRPCVAGRVLGFGCASLVVVLGYSATLCRAALRTPEERKEAIRAEMEQHLAQVNEHTRAALRAREPLRVLLADLRQGLREGRYTLRQAADLLADSEPGRDPGWLRVLAQVHHDRPQAERIGAFVLQNFVGVEGGQSQQARQIALRLEKEYRAVYGSAPPTDVAAQHRPGPGWPTGMPRPWHPRHRPGPPPGAGFGARP